MYRINTGRPETSFYLYFFNWIFSLFIFQMSSPFLVPPSKNTVPLPLPTTPYPCSPTHPLPLSGPGIPLHWSIQPSQDKGPLLPLMSNQAILCCMCSWSHESHHLCSLVGGVVPGSSAGTGQFMLFLLWGCKTLQFLGSFLQLFHGESYAKSNGWL